MHKININKIKNSLLVISTLMLPYIAVAEEGFEAKLKGSMDFTSVFHSKEKDDNKNVTKNNKSFGFSTEADLSLQASYTTSNNLEYGAVIGIETSTKNTRSMPSYIFFTTELGKLELGSGKSAFKGLATSAYKIAAATGGGWDSWVDLNPKDLKINYAPGYSNMVDSKVRTKGKVEFPRKITYYTPSFNGFSLGVSYIPDASNAGHGSIDGDNSFKPSKYFYKVAPKEGGNILESKIKQADISFSIKDAIAGGVLYEKLLSDDLSVRFSVVGETAKVVHEYKDSEDMSDDDKDRFKKATFNDVKSVMLGGILKYKKFSIAGSYYNYGKSFASKELDTGKASYTFTIGSKYEINKFNTSLHYQNSNFRGNKVDAITLAMDYKLAPGLKPYAECTLYSSKGEQLGLDQKTDQRKGTLFLMGTKLSF